MSRNATGPHIGTPPRRHQGRHHTPAASDMAPPGRSRRVEPSARYIGRVGALAVALGIGAAATVPAVGWAIPAGDTATATGDPANSDTTAADTNPTGHTNNTPSGSPVSTPPSSTVSATTTTGTQTTTTGAQTTTTTSTVGTQTNTTTTTIGDDDTPKVTISAHTNTSATTPDEPSADTPVEDPDQHAPDPTAPTTAGPHVSVSHSGTATTTTTVSAVETAPELERPAPQTRSSSTLPEVASGPADTNPAPSQALTGASAASTYTPLDQFSAPQTHRPVVQTATLSITSAADNVIAALAPAEPVDPITALLQTPSTLINSAVNTVVSFFEALVGPGALFDNPTLWGLLAWVRRETNKNFGNQTPILAPQQFSGQDADDNQVHGTFGPPDPDGDTLTFAVADRGQPGGPVNGTITVDQTSRTWTYTPGTDWDGTRDITDSFTVTVSDAGSGFHIHAPGHTDTATATVQVTVAHLNQPPEADPDPEVGLPDAQGVVMGSVTATDSDHDTLTYRGSLTTATGTEVQVDPGGSFTYTPSTTDRHAAAGNPAQNGTFTFDVIADDGHGHTTPISVTVTVLPQNDAPAIAEIETGDPDPQTGIVEGYVIATDPDGDAVSYAAEEIGTGKGTAVIHADGTFTYRPSDTARHSAAAVNADPADKQDAFDVTITDRYGGITTAPVTVTIAGANSSPTGATSNPGQPAGALGQVTGTVTATDQDHDTLIYSGTGFTPEGDVVVNSDGTFNYTPTEGARHEAAATNASDADKHDTFTVTINDGHGGTTTHEVTVTVGPKNDAPASATSNPGQPTGQLGQVTGTVTATDLDHDSLVYSGTGPTPKGNVVVNSDGTFTYTPTVEARLDAANPRATAADLRDNFVVTISDGHGGNTPLTVTVAIGAPADNAVVANLPTIGNPFVVAFSPDGTRAYVGDNGGRVTVIDTATNTRVTTVVVRNGIPTFGVAVSPDGRYVYATTSGNNGTVSVIDTSTNAVTATIPVGDFAWRPVVSPDGGRLYVVNGNSSTVSVINTATNAVVATIPVAGGVKDAAISPNGGRLYVTNGGHTVSVIDTASFAVSTPITISGDFTISLVVNADGSRLYAANSNGTVSVVNTATNAVTATLSVGSFGPFARPISLTPDGTRLYVPNSQMAPNVQGTVAMIDTATNTVKAVIPVAGNPYGVQVSPDGSRLYVMDSNGQSVSSVIAIVPWASNVRL